MQLQRIAPSQPLQRHQQLQRGGHTGASRGAQRLQPIYLPAICDDSAPLAGLPARHFSGKSSQIAQTAIKKEELNPLLFKLSVLILAFSVSWRLN